MRQRHCFYTLNVKCSVAHFFARLFLFRKKHRCANNFLRFLAGIPLTFIPHIKGSRTISFKYIKRESKKVTNNHFILVLGVARGYFQLPPRAKVRLSSMYGIIFNCKQLNCNSCFGCCYFSIHKAITIAHKLITVCGTHAHQGNFS